MNGIALVFVMASAVALLLLPRRWAPAPLVAGACYMTLGQGVEIGPFTFTVIRILVAVGAVRVVVRRESLATRMNALDWLMVLWSCWASTSSLFHNPQSSALVYRLGMAYNACGIYFLLRIFCSSTDDVVRLCRTTAMMLSPIAVAMLYERAAHHNVFSMFGGVDAVPMIREGRIRASGPFAHPILAGTVGAVALPFMIATWRAHRLTAFVGLLACLAIILASASSGPVLSAVFGVGGLIMWRFRHQMRTFRWAAVTCCIVLSLVMKAPIYYLIARIDVVGGSTGWHRSRLIESSFEHLNEWWFAGTDYTRHWMLEGMAWDHTQVDITNHYLSMGVVGGLPLVLLFIAILATAFSYVGKRELSGGDRTAEDRFVVWALGCALFAHTVTFVSVSYLDQSIVFLYLTLAAIGSMRLQPQMAAARIATSPTAAARAAPLKPVRLPAVARVVRPARRGTLESPRLG